MNKEDYNKYYIQGSDHYLIPKDEFEELFNEMINLKEEAKELKKQVEEYKATNKILSHELTKDKVLQQDCLTTCCGIPIGDIPKLITQQKEFTEWLEAMSKMYENEYKDIDIAGHYNCVLAKYKEIIGGEN